jgi:hypothetical protein
MFSPGSSETLDVWVYPKTGVDPSKWKAHPHVEALLKKVRRWQGIKNRQEGLTKTMVAALRCKYAGNSWDSHNQSLVDLLVISLHTGYRRVRMGTRVRVQWEML